METNVTAESLAPYAKAVEGPMFIWPLIGLMAALFFASFQFESPAIRGTAIAVYVVGVFVIVGMQAAKSGVQPSFRAMPLELRKNLYRFWGLSVVIALGALALGFTTNFVVAGLVVGIGMTLCGLQYHARSRGIVKTLQGAL